MRKPIVWSVGAALLLTVVWAQSPLPEPAQKVVDYLLADWSKHMHSTSIAQAMANLGMEPDDDLRLQVGEHFRANPDLHFNLRSWAANNYILSDEEKRIAKFLIAHFEAEEELPETGLIAKALGIEAIEVERRTAFLSRAGFLQPSDHGSDYRLTEKYRRWGGPLRFNYHTITIGEEDPFAVW